MNQVQLEGQIQRGRGMREASNTDSVNAGLSVAADVAQVDSSGNFKRGAAAGEFFHDAADLGGGHVVEEDDVGAGVDGLGDFVAVAGFGGDADAGAGCGGGFTGSGG